MSASRSGLRRVLAGSGTLLVTALLLPGAAAGADLTLDAATINELLVALTPERFEIPIRGGRPVAVRVSDLKVTGFDPDAGSAGNGHVLTSLLLEAPELGLRVPVTPRVSLEVVEQDKEKMCLVRFRDVTLPVPMIGSIDVSRALPVIRLPVENLYAMQGGQGEVRIRTRLVDVLMGTTGLRLRFDVDATPVAGQAAAGG